VQQFVRIVQVLETDSHALRQGGDARHCTVVGPFPGPRGRSRSVDCLGARLAKSTAGAAPTLGCALSVSAFNASTAVGSSIAGLALSSALGFTGPAVVGTVISALTLIPVLILARARYRRRSATPAVRSTEDAAASGADHA
jgi:hypothetical protein